MLSSGMSRGTAPYSWPRRPLSTRRCLWRGGKTPIVQAESRRQGQRSHPRSQPRPSQDRRPFSAHSREAQPKSNHKETSGKKWRGSIMQKTGREFYAAKMEMSLKKRTEGHVVPEQTEALCRCCPLWLHGPAPRPDGLKHSG